MIDYKEIELEIQTKNIPRIKQNNPNLLYSRLMAFTTVEHNWDYDNKMYPSINIIILKISKKGKKAKDYKEKIKGAYKIEIWPYIHGCYLPYVKNKFWDLYKFVGFDLYTRDKNLFRDEYNLDGCFLYSKQKFRNFHYNTYHSLNKLLIRINKKEKNLEKIIQEIKEYKLKNFGRYVIIREPYVSIRGTGIPFTFKGQHCIDFIEWKKLLVEFYGKIIDNFNLETLKFFDDAALMQLQALLDYSEIAAIKTTKNPLDNLYYYLKTSFLDTQQIKYYFPATIIEMLKAFEYYLKNNQEKEFLKTLIKVYDIVEIEMQAWINDSDSPTHGANVMHILDFGLGTKFRNEYFTDAKIYFPSNNEFLWEKIYTDGPSINGKYECEKLRILNLGGIYLKENSQNKKLSLEQMCYLYCFIRHLYGNFFVKKNILKNLQIQK